MNPAALVIAAGVAAALHVGKLPPALPVLQQVLDVSLVQAGFLLALMQLAGMTLGLPAALLVPRYGARRIMLAGLLILGLASAWGGAAQGVTGLLLSRALEGLGFLCVVLPAPGLLRALVPAERLSPALGAWGAYMPLGAALALLAGPWVMMTADVTWGWRIWWWVLSLLTVLLAVLVFYGVPADQRRVPGDRLRSASGADPLFAAHGLLRLTLGSRAVWLVALCFSVYSGQWLAVVGFLPSIYSQAGVAIGTAAALTALVAAVNIVGNLVAGRLLQTGTAPFALLLAGFAAMSVSAMAAFGADAAFWWRYLAVLAFSMLGGLIPGTLFSLAVRLAPSAATVPTTVGWMQQWSALGQFFGPPLVAAVVNQTGSWQWTWVVTGGFSLAGVALAWQIHSLSKMHP
ncbi:CynX/NimT family MFS transporter [Polaromonas sp. A23]|uniref:MFS transporter n=1 Tax=Polaromonas sp. A23 TaxID=1944133 RepID=UPI0009865208|nr:MFS transporter [Polaromonas sp. A23]OOG41234.1 MFS transporter [Polaromonas sp. A23]